MNIERYKCFGATALNGNDAVVVSGPELSGWSLQERQQFTIDQNAHACVFVDTDGSASGQLTLDFYYPHHGALCVCMRRLRLLITSGIQGSTAEFCC